MVPMRFAAKLLFIAFLACPLPNALAQEAMPSGFVDAAASVDGLVTDLRYFGEYNFVGERIDGYEQPRCLLTVPAATALAFVSHELAARGLALKVFDCYRPARAVAHFVRWARDITDVKSKSEFYPDVDKRDLFRDGYIAERSGHSRGSTVDVTLIRRETGQEIDMGTAFDLFSPKSWPDSPSITWAQRANRKMLANAMARGRFKPYDKEWWHFTLANEPFPDTYFDFPVR
jgi:D-alanyl-D-alanine dipeptidase